MKDTMTKYEAEQLLGLTGAYVYKDTLKAYRNKVKTCHPDVGGSAEEMIKVNKAKEYMDKLFANNKNAVMSCDSAPFGTDGASASRSKNKASNPSGASTNRSYRDASSTSASNSNNASRNYDTASGYEQYKMRNEDFTQHFNRSDFTNESDYWDACANAASATGNTWKEREYRQKAEDERRRESLRREKEEWERTAPNGRDVDGFAFPRDWDERRKEIYWERIAYEQQREREANGTWYNEEDPIGSIFDFVFGTTPAPDSPYYSPPKGDSYSAPKGDPVVVDYDQVVDQVVETANTIFNSNNVYATPDYAKDENVPDWYKRIDWAVQHFPWRLTLCFIAAIYGMWFVFIGPEQIDLWNSLIAVIAVFAPLINLITGCLTNPIRKFLRRHADKALLKWQHKHQKRI